jgi:hypothetical protein
LELFFFQASQLVSGAVLVVFLNQVKWPNVQKCLKACHQLVNEAFFLLVVSLVLPAVVGLLVVNLWVLEVKYPQISFVLA